MTNTAAVQWIKDQGLLVAPEGAKAQFAWIDVETTGLDYEDDELLEVAVILTDGFGRVIPGSVLSSLCFDPKPKDWNDINAFVMDMHEKSGLWKDRADIKPDHRKQFSLEAVEKILVAHLKNYGDHSHLQLAGSSVNFDATFLLRDMPKVIEYLHYRQINVSSFLEVMKRVNPELAARANAKRDIHRPLADLVDSLKLYEFVLDNFLFIPGSYDD